MDIAYLLALQDVRAAAGPVFEQAAVLLSAFAASALLMIVPCVVYWCVDKKVGTLAMFSFGIGNFLNQVVKNIVCAYRPWVRSSAIVPAEGALEGATGYSFPSGHTVTIATVLGAVGWGMRKRAKWILPVCVVVILAAAGTRNYLGVHTPQDVLVALCLAIAVIACVGPFLRWVEAAPGRDLKVMVVGLTVCAAFLVYATLKPYPLDYTAEGALLVDPADMIVDCYKSAGMFAGMLIGWFAERRLVGFDATCTLRVGLFRGIVGTVLMLTMYVAGGALLKAAFGLYAGNFLRTSLTFITAAYATPALFTWAEPKLFSVKH